MEIFIDEITAESWEKFSKTESFETLRKGNFVISKNKEDEEIN